MKCDKEAAGNVGNFPLPLLEYQSFSLSDSFFYHWSDDHGDDHRTDDKEKNTVIFRILTGAVERQPLYYLLL